MKPKQALVKDGFTEGDHTWSSGDESKRGRLSQAAKDRLTELAASGWTIDDYSTSTSSTGEVTVTKVKSDPNAVVDIPSPTRDEKTMTAWAGTQSVGMRTVCNICRRSLTYCLCEQPRVWAFSGDHEVVVTFRAN